VLFRSTIPEHHARYLWGRARKFGYLWVVEFLSEVLYRAGNSAKISHANELLKASRPNGRFKFSIAQIRLHRIFSSTRIVPSLSK